MIRFLLALAGAILVFRPSSNGGGPPTAATEIPTTGGHGMLFVVGLVVVGLVVLVVKAGSHGRAVASDRTCRPSGHSHGTVDRRQVRGPAQDGNGSHWSPSERRGIERHERRHQRVADRLGVGGNWWVHDGGGSFVRNNDSHLSGVQRAAISYAGNGGSWWAGSPCDKQDEANGDYYVESAYPRGEWSARKREARALARRLS